MDNKVKNVSIIVPFYNEEDNVNDIYQAIKASCESILIPYEIIFVDDGSTDNTFQLIEKLALSDNLLRVLKFQYNCGQTAAMQAGFDYASHELIIPMDGDMQNDPADIPRLIQKIEEGYDVVSGWRKDRKDKTLSRKIPSMLANKLISYIGKVPLHDYGCSLKAYRASVIKNVTLYGEMHRFIPIYSSWYGAKVTEIPVKHHPRTKGKSKYGISRTYKVILDLITIKFLGRYSTKPIYFFGKLGLLAFFSAFIGISYMVYRQIVDGQFIDSPAFLFTVMCVLLGVQFILMGLLAEVQIRTYHESQRKRQYQIDQSININKES